MVNNDSNPLLDQWNEKHIEILRDKFQEFLQKAGKDKNRSVSKGSSDANGGGLDKQAFMKVFADLKTFPKVFIRCFTKLIASG